MITVRVNGEAWRLGADATVADVVGRLSSQPRGIAVAVDGAVVPRTRWVTTPVRDGAVVEVLTAVQGG